MATTHRHFVIIKGANSLSTEEGTLKRVPIPFSQSSNHVQKMSGNFTIYIWFTKPPTACRKSYENNYKNKAEATNNMMSSTVSRPMEWLVS